MKPWQQTLFAIELLACFGAYVFLLFILAPGQLVKLLTLDFKSMYFPKFFVAVGGTCGTIAVVSLAISAINQRFRGLHSWIILPFVVLGILALLYGDYMFSFGKPSIDPFVLLPILCTFHLLFLNRSKILADLQPNRELSSGGNSA